MNKKTILQFFKYYSILLIGIYRVYYGTVFSVFHELHKRSQNNCFMVYNCIVL